MFFKESVKLVAQLTLVMTLVVMTFILFMVINVLKYSLKILALLEVNVKTALTSKRIKI